MSGRNKQIIHLISCFIANETLLYTHYSWKNTLLFIQPMIYICLIVCYQNYLSFKLADINKILSRLRFAYFEEIISRISLYHYISLLIVLQEAEIILLVFSYFFPLNILDASNQILWLDKLTELFRSKLYKEHVYA